ncbi:polysaccharide deacetylase family protein [Chitinophaga sp. 22620]|uniref:polysaccharide deacetylase family protein n=1 Tax=Chitinophaga sp. 22620 TaxID=3453952 RepID=UPI003F8518A8
MLYLLLLLALAQGTPQTSGPAVPVLCYHHVTAGDTHAASPLYIHEKDFRLQMQTLADSGFHSILPDELYACMAEGKPLPPRPVLISFDDSHKEHYTIAAPALEKAGFRGTFFVMTVTIGKKGYLSGQDIYALHKKGHAIGCHTWDHPHLSGELGLPDAERQLRKARETLEKITGSPVTSFAYPFGAWNETLVKQLQDNGFRIAFQLSGTGMSRSPQFTVRRIMVNGGWKGTRLLAEIRESFQL